MCSYYRRSGAVNYPVRLEAAEPDWMSGPWRLRLYYRRSCHWLDRAPIQSRAGARTALSGISDDQRAVTSERTQRFTSTSWTRTQPPIVWRLRPFCRRVRVVFINEPYTLNICAVIVFFRYQNNSMEILYIFYIRTGLRKFSKCPPSCQKKRISMKNHNNTSFLGVQLRIIFIIVLWSLFDNVIKCKTYDEENIPVAVDTMIKRIIQYPLYRELEGYVVKWQHGTETNYKGQQSQMKLFLFRLK